jgi:hypothetical protein
MVYFQTKNTKLDKFWRVLQWTMLVYFMTIGLILCPFGNLEYFPRFGIMYQEKSFNHARDEFIVIAVKYWQNFRARLKKQIIHFPECSGSEKTGYNVSAIKMFRK